MRFRARQFVVLLTSMCVIAFCSLLLGCGSSSNSSTKPVASGGGNGSSGSGGSGSGGSGSGSSGSGNSGSGGSGSGSGSSGSGSGSGSGGSGSGGSGSGGSGSGGSGSGGSGSGSSSFVSYAYSSDSNAIHAYSVTADGTLTAAPNSPYSQAENSSAPPMLATNGTNLYTVDQSGAKLVIFPFDKTNGSLGSSTSTSIIAGDPGASDFASALSVDHSGSNLYAQVGLPNEDSGINVFTIGSSASARQLQFVQEGSTAPSALVFSPNNQFAYSDACSARDDEVDGYARASNGTLTNIKLTQPQPPSGPQGEAFCPEAMAVSAMNYLAIEWDPFQYGSSITVGDQTYVMIYQINADGSLAVISNSQTTTASTDAIKVAMRFDPTGKFLAVAGNGGVQTYALLGNGTLSPAGAPQDAGTNFVNVAWDKSNHVFASTNNQLFAFNSQNGTLTAASGSPQGGGSGLTVLPLQ